MICADLYWCAKSMMQIWVNLSLFFSFHWGPHDMWVSEEVWEECWRRHWDFFYVNFNRILDDFTTCCRSLFAVRLWQKDWSTTRPWRTWIWLTTTLVIPRLRLGVWWGWWGSWGTGHEGGEVRQYGSRQSSSKVKWWNEWKEDYTEDWCWDVPSPSCRSEWIWACSFHFIGDHMICEYQRKYEKNVVELVEISCTWFSKNLRWFHHVFRRSLFAVRHWQKDWSTTWLWQTWICNSTTLALKGLRLGVWWGWWGSWGIGHERRGKTV